MPRVRSLTDWVLVRAWVEPGHEQPLRVVVRHRRDSGPEEDEEAFADATSAAAFVRAWLVGLQRRWESGESRDAGDAEGWKR